MNRSFGHSPPQANRYLQSRQYCGSPSRLAKPKSIWRREKTISEIGLLADIAQAILGVNVVVAGVDAAVVLQRQTLAAELAGDAPLRRHAHPLDHSRLKQIDQHPAQILAIPFIEDLAEKGAVVVWVEPTSR